MAFKFSSSTNQQRLTRIKVVAGHRRWNLIDESNEQVSFKKKSTLLTIDGYIFYTFNVLEHSVTTTLNHNGKIKTLKRFIKKDVWRPIEFILAYPRHHLGDNNLETQYIK
jgi:hypothetical protein